MFFFSRYPAYVTSSGWLGAQVSFPVATRLSCFYFRLQRWKNFSPHQGSRLSGFQPLQNESRREHRQWPPSWQAHPLHYRRSTVLTPWSKASWSQEWRVTKKECRPDRSGPDDRRKPSVGCAAGNRLCQEVRSDKTVVRLWERAEIGWY